ncbi:hypothetical protein PR202_ga11395 [Eleusine coracana subsp. coracana]|uniref:NAB domain-containing protein n=1 Tax=Eleusine coracana subsp. coracana TaxID=191504 RepID=A0AAV5C9C3_ELECO|nr:hypothetical protein PR202_ga11395 [Eleusine coracana subsp. coracana]
MHHEEILQISDIESNNFQNDLEETASALESSTEINNEKEALQAVLMEHKNEIEVLKGAMASASERFEVELAHRDLEIDKCKHELQALSEKYLHDKSTFEAELTKLQGVIKNLERDFEVSGKEVAKLPETMKNLEAQLERALEEKSALQDRIKELEQVMCDSLEKHSKEQSSLRADLLKLSESNASLEEFDIACKSLSELRARVSELEDEVKKQKLMISESAEGKREAIRQLCFSPLNTTAVVDADGDPCKCGKRELTGADVATTVKGGDFDAATRDVDAQMKKTPRVQSRKNNSWWWDRHISPQSSKCLSENLEEMEKQVKEMLGFIEEEEGEFSAEKAEVFYQKRPLLITHVKNCYQMYRALAERYDSVTGELRKNIASSMQSHGSLGISESDSETHGSGVRSDASKKGSEGSSSSSESDSELEQTKEENGNIFYALSQKITELEDELHEARGKLETLEEKNMHHEEILQISDIESNNFQNDLEETASALESSTEINNEKEALQAVLMEHKNEIEVLKGAMASASERFEVELAHRDLEIDKCKHELQALSEKYLHDKSTFEAELTKLQGVIKNLEGDLAKMSQEKLQLESRIEELEKKAQNLEYSASEVVKLQEVVKNTQAELEKVAEEKEVLKENAIEFEQLFRDFEVSGKRGCKASRNHEEPGSPARKSLRREISTSGPDQGTGTSKLSSVETELMRVYVEKEEESLNNEKQISVLNQDIANLRSKLELLSSEKATADNNLANLLTDITSRDEKMKKMDDHLNQVKLEHDKLVSEFDIACKSLSELRARVSELEDEVKKQKLMISESAEGKREAIRQLCFSLEHYRSGYQELRQLLHGHRRPLVMAT